MFLKNFTVIRHIATDTLGHLESLFLSEGYKISYIDAGIDDLKQINSDDVDLLWILGGPISAFQEKTYSFITDEIHLLEQRLIKDLPTVGICLGSQLLARALGQRVYKNDQAEIGWSQMTMTKEGLNNPIHHLSSENTYMFHWHYDTFDLPAEANLLASTTCCKNQIFSFGKNILAFQCHPEVSKISLEQWWNSHSTILDKLTLQKLRKQTTQYAPKLETQSKRCFSEWLKSLTKGKENEQD